MALDTLGLDYAIGFETPDMESRILDMTDRAFGPGRYVKTAERLREQARPIAELSFVAQQGGRLMGSVRLWPVQISEPGQPPVALAFLGPIVVEGACRGQGIGKALVRKAVEAAFAKGVSAVLLVGARSYFEPLGFVPASDMTLPGPVDPKRLLIAYPPSGGALRGRVSKAV